MVQFYIYELVDPRTDRVFYVGKGCRNRIDAHEVEASSGRQSRKCDMIRAIWVDGLQVAKRKVSHHSDEQEAYDAEADLVAAYGLANLTNVVPGGGVAFAGVSRFKERVDIIGMAQFFNRTRNLAIHSIIVAGSVLDLKPIAEAYKIKLSEAVDRRGLDWVNDISSRHGLVLVDG